VLLAVTQQSNNDSINNNIHPTDMIGRDERFLAFHILQQPSKNKFIIIGRNPNGRSRQLIEVQLPKPSSRRQADDWQGPQQ